MILKNTALNLAAADGHQEIVTHLLSINEQEILMNAYNQNVLDIALKEEKKDVVMAISDHSRCCNNVHMVDKGIFSFYCFVQEVPITEYI